MGAWSDDLLGNDHVQDEISIFSRKKPEKLSSYLKKLMNTSRARRAEDYEIETFVGLIFHILEAEVDTKKVKKVTKTMIKECITQIKLLKGAISLQSWRDPHSRLKQLKEAEAVFKKALKAKK